jgi:hypothetical protein
MKSKQSFMFAVTVLVTSVVGRRVKLVSVDSGKGDRIEGNHVLSLLGSHRRRRHLAYSLFCLH